jgi:hypothetical protein
VHKPQLRLTVKRLVERGRDCAHAWLRIRRGGEPSGYARVCGAQSTGADADSSSVAFVTAVRANTASPFALAADIAIQASATSRSTIETPSGRNDIDAFR